MSRLKKNIDDKAVKVTFTIDPETLDKLKKYCQVEILPLSRAVTRIIKRFLEMR